MGLASPSAYLYYGFTTTCVLSSWTFIFARRSLTVTFCCVCGVLSNPQTDHQRARSDMVRSAPSLQRASPMSSH
jgi:hypothetical protein